MDKKLITVIGVLGGLILIYFINLSVQSSYSSSTAKLFTISEDSINKIVISSKQDAIELIKNDTCAIIIESIQGVGGLDEPIV